MPVLALVLAGEDEFPRLEDADPVLLLAEEGELLVDREADLADEAAVVRLEVGVHDDVEVAVLEIHFGRELLDELALPFLFVEERDEAGEEAGDELAQEAHGHARPCCRVDALVGRCCGLRLVDCRAADVAEGERQEDERAREVHFGGRFLKPRPTACLRCKLTTLGRSVG